MWRDYGNFYRTLLEPTLQYDTDSKILYIVKHKRVVMSNEVWKVMVNNQIYETDLENLKEWILEGRIDLKDKVEEGTSWVEIKNIPVLKAVCNQVIGVANSNKQNNINPSANYSQLANTQYQKTTYPIINNQQLPPDQFIIQIPGFEGRKVIFQKANLFSNPQLIVDGQPAQKSDKRGHYLLCRNDGTKATAYFRSVLFDPIPKLIVDGQTILLAEPLRLLEWGFIGLPFILVILGGLIGGLLGGLAAVLNGQIFRSSLNTTVKYIASLGTLVASLASYVVVIFILSLVFGQNTREIIKNAVTETGDKKAYEQYAKSIKYIEPHWQDFSSLKWGFKLLMPSEPVEETDSIDSFAGMITRHNFIARAKYYSFYKVSYMQLPLGTKMDDPSTILKTSCEESVRKFKGHVVSSSGIGPTKDENGVSYRKFSMFYSSDGEMSVTVKDVSQDITVPLSIFGKAILQDSQIYIVEVSAMRGAISEAEARKFLETFTITNSTN